MAEEFDVLIIGGGMVGASLACALHHQPLRIAVVEAVPLSATSQPSFDDRVIALAYGSRRIFDGIGIWTSLKERATPIRNIHVSDRGRFGCARIDCRDEGVPALGYVLKNRDIGHALSGHIAGSTNISFFCPAQMQSLNVDDEGATVTIEINGRPLSLRTRLVIGADGGQSRVREVAGIGVQRREYGQTAVITNVDMEKHHNHVAYERFTDSGPLAFLPMEGHQCSVVWTILRENIEKLQALSDDEFRDRLQRRFGYRLGKIEQVGRRITFPLQLVRATESVRPRIALVGNAVHTLHPVAGQGFNLGLRDVAVMAEVIVDATRRHQDPGAEPILRRYSEQRRRDHRDAIFLTDSLVRLFSNSLMPVALARDAGMMAIEHIPFLKHFLARQTMGIKGRQPKLARGIPL